MKDCPFCGFTGLETQLRCPKCSQALTLWRNWDAFARQSYCAGLHALDHAPHAAAALFTRAVAFDPGNPDYLFALGCTLASGGASAEATTVLEKALALSNRKDIDRALKSARDLVEGAAALHKKSHADGADDDDDATSD
jgi:hypothetical protein